MTTQHPAITTYQHATAGIPDSFDCLTARSLHDHQINAFRDGKTPASAAVHTLVCEYLDMINNWYDAIDNLDSELRAHVTAGSLPDDQALYLKQQAMALFEASTALLRAIAEYHHGAAGPALDPAYGHAYALSNSTLRPF
jgi:hypothetical protein